MCGKWKLPGEEEKPLCASESCQDGGQRSRRLALFRMGDKVAQEGGRHGVRGRSDGEACGLSEKIMAHEKICEPS